MTAAVKVSDLTLRRLPKYRQYLIRLRKQGEEYTSAAEIGRVLGVHHTQVRKDLQSTGVRGVPKVGHRIDDLIKGIEEFLNWTNLSDAFLVGVGNMGKAILNYEGFSRAGIKIVAAFDIDNRIQGKEIQSIPVFGMEKLSDLSRRLQVKIGILCTPPTAAQESAELLVAGGVIAIWNFTPTKLELPEKIIVESVNIYPSLAVLSRRLMEQLIEMED